MGRRGLLDKTGEDPDSIQVYQVTLRLVDNDL